MSDRTSMLIVAAAMMVAALSGLAWGWIIWGA